VTSGMKQQLASQLSDGKLKDYIIEKEQWSQYTFDSVAWRDYKIAYKRLSKNRQVNISKSHGKEKWEVLRREEIMLPLQRTRRILDQHTNLSVNRRMHKQGRIVGKGAKGDDKLEAPK
jgi:hypothetical protein